MTSISRRARAVRPCDNPFNAQRIDALPYIEHAIALDDVMHRLAAHHHRGAIVGPHGCGKSAMLEALGPRLQAKGLRPRPLFMNSDERGRLPRRWRAAIRSATAEDALLLDGYDLLPRWARLWVLIRSRKAGAVVVTTHQASAFKTIARPQPSRQLLAALLAQLADEDAHRIDAASLHKQSRGNLREALRRAYDLYAKPGATPDHSDAAAGPMAAKTSESVGSC